MNSKPLHINNILSSKSGSNISKGIPEPFPFVSDNLNHDNLPESNFNLRFNELKGINARLEKLIEEQEKKLAQVVDTNAQFLSIIAHDLRSPFSSIISVLELLKDSYNDYNLKEVEKYIRMATNSANGTLNLLDNLLVWTAAQNKSTYFNPVRINLPEIVKEELEDNKTAASHKQIILSHSVSPKLYIAADIQMVKTIMRNLINNAIKYSFIGGEIIVRAVAVEQFVEITVEDYGIGIKHQAQLELFIRDKVHTTRGTNNEFGTGLGLILCKDFVEKHGGQIWIESESGKGCKIKFTLPCYSNGCR